MSNDLRLPNFDAETTVRLAIRPARTPVLSLAWAGGTLHFDENLNVLGWQAEEPDDQPGAAPLNHLNCLEPS